MYACIYASIFEVYFSKYPAYPLGHGGGECHLVDEAEPVRRPLIKLRPVRAHVVACTETAPSQRRIIQRRAHEGMAHAGSASTPNRQYGKQSTLNHSNRSHGFSPLPSRFPSAYLAASQ